MALLVTALKILFLVLTSAASTLLLFILLTNPTINFLLEIIRQPWMTASSTNLGIYAITVSLWIAYKESNWTLASLRIIPVVLLGSLSACGYVAIQLAELTDQESEQDPIFFVLQTNKTGDERRSNNILSALFARIIFISLGSLMLGLFIYASITGGTPFRIGFLTQWLTLTLVDGLFIGIIMSVWIAYKEESWVTAALWIVLLLCFGSVVLCGYIVVQLYRLSPQDPAFLILFNGKKLGVKEV